MRFIAGWLAFLSMAAYAWRDWVAAICFMIVTMAFIERPDFPKSGIPGLSAWNLVFFSTIFAFIFKFSKAQQLHKLEKMPGNIKGYLWYYLFFIILAFLREAFDYDGINEFAMYQGSNIKVNFKVLFINDVFNTLKYAIPGILCYYAANDRKSIVRILLSIVALNLILSLLVIKVMPIAALTDGKLLEQTGIRKIDRDIGYYRSDLAILFAGGAWVTFIIKDALKSWVLKNACYVASFAMVMAMSLTGGRIGMGAWLVLGVVIAYYRWKRLLIIGPVIVVLVVSFVPAVQERFLQGLVADEHSETGEADATSATSGRSEIWPHVIDNILESPLIGNGRRAMQRIGLSQWLGETINQPFPHPHNAYLQLFLDNGLILGLPIIIFYMILLGRSFSLFRDSRNDLYVLVGGCAFSLLVAQLVGFIGSQSFYPFTSSTSLWCSMGLALRLYQKREIVIKNKGDHALLLAEDEELKHDKKKRKTRR